MNSSSVRSVVLAGGGTAGHVNPLLAVADELRAREPEASFLVLGTASGLEAELVPARGYELREVPRVPLPRRPSVDLLRLPGRLGVAVRAAEAAIDEIDAQAVVGFGGYVSTPAYLAARRRGVPVVIHEQNARPGLANRLGARWAAAVATTFEQTALPGATCVGLPLRAEIAALVDARQDDAVAARARAADVLGLDPSLPTLLVTGGSSGAVRVNEAVAGAAGALLGAGVQVLHLTGKGKDAAVRDVVDRAVAAGGHEASRYQVREYLPEMHEALAACDLVVARSGAGTVCELAALGLPAVYVPLPVGNGEQRLNAAGVVGAGGGLLVEDAQFDAAWVADYVPGLVVDADRLGPMADAARSVGVRDAAARVADLVAGAVAGRAR
ncbi:undecaprenyldiphospho-muramoylpentapeptide beta-N-acetylglucosaminyltransferase [Isoptericola halotolerans]|uniref:UDP-N-acetylglucosamine--N-acetylmuramyl-(pentapeptide) pyrophosphoryl-undecaprenol N-acetylglucosamine transferase n=3 Tax=Isoptericola halotolerans TaxID=300560 RepID=A0ABX2A247_9MICO|nr:UDP-N-acetylmuramate--alanine ligase/UDP-N-acetylglucosamine--N-acetylmuramyl-(pentapeptide) pyrophosphoryl-undecaprenol N-acetylglucosamine transferase [Isoptericola halotolerans]